MTSILFPNNGRQRPPKLHISNGTLPPYIDPGQPPTKRVPWRQIRETPFIASVTVSLPSSLHDNIWHKLDADVRKIRYAKVFMSLEDILTGDFFNTYIKVGNIMMISEGQPGAENIFTLCEGILRLDLGKEDYQRAGLQGSVSTTHGGRKHVKERFIVEYNLRSPSMVGGKKGFDRLLYAAKNVLNASKLWLFRDLMPTLHDNNSDATTALMEHHPMIVEQDPQVNELEHVAVPDMVSNPTVIVGPPRIDEREDYYELAEWLDLVAIKSPRVQRYDRPDSYISRYTPPGMSHGEPPPTRPIPIRILQWTGLIDSGWLTKLVIEIVKHSRAVNSDQWLALTVNAHSTQALGQIDGYTILLQPSPGAHSAAISKSQPSASQSNHLLQADELQSVEPSSNSSAHAGIQRFMCLQFVDS